MVFAIALMAAWPITGDGLPYKTNSIPALSNLLSLLDDNKLFKVSLSVILIFIQALLLNNLIIRHKLSRALSTIPAAVFVLFSSFVIEDYHFHPVLIANVFCLLSINSLFKIYKKHLPIVTIFNSGFWMAVASIIYQPYIVYFIVLLIGLYSMRNLDLRESLQMFLGLLAPMGLIVVWAFYHGQLHTILLSVIDNFSVPDLSKISLLNMLKPLLTLSFIILAGLFHNEIKKKKKFDAIKKIELGYWLMLFSIFTIFLMSPLQQPHLIIVSIPIAISLGLLLESKNNSVIKEFLFLLGIGVYVGFLLDVV